MLSRLRLLSGKRFLSHKVANSVHNDLIKVSASPKYTTFSFKDPQVTYSFHNVFLRDSSDSKTSLDPATGQKLFTTGEILESYPVDFKILEDSKVLITWSDGDECIYTKAFLDKHATVDSRFDGRYYHDDVTLWKPEEKPKFPQLPHYDYHEYINNNETLAQVVKDLNKFGIAIISSVPSQSDQENDSNPLVAKIGERIGYIKPTFYGYTFDVKSKPDATNIAYTSKFLPLHHDLCYYESPPGLQLLHFIKNKATGGENVFADGFAAAQHVKHVDPEAYRALLTVPINFHYNRDGHHYFQSRHLVVEDDTLPDSAIYHGKDHFKEVNYSPPFQAPFDFGITGPDTNSTGHLSSAKDSGDRHLFQDFLRGLKLFEDFINKPENRLKFKTEEGSCVIFDNRRVLHARDEFDPQSGERWLKGCYLDKDAFQSKLRAVHIGDF
jgi:alpha-ketoglutarate-dependent taurine dioxygenase